MKQKSKKTLKKRIKVTGTGKLMYKQVRTGHLKRKWSTNQKFRKRSLGEITNRGHKKIIKNLLNI